MSTKTSPKVWRNYIDGKWVEASSGKTTELPNPATEQTFAIAPDSERADIRQAIEAARRAFDSGPWSRTTVQERASLLHRIGDAIERRKGDFRDALVQGHAAEGMTLPIQLERPIEFFHFYADLALRFDFEENFPTVVNKLPTGAQVVNTCVNRQPVGVCGMIPTWNFPFFVSTRKIAPAIATGCTMVFKPSPYGPVIDFLLAEVLEECDVPPGVFNVVSGQSPELGAELSESPLVDKISFTGSVATGKKIMEACSRTLKRVHLELGGKSALIVLDDADLDSAAPGAASPTFFHAGQGCAMTTRVLVGRDRHDPLVERMAGFVKNFVKIGDPADPSVLLGPVIREERRTFIERYIASGREQGADLVTGGGRPAHLPRGYFLEPTIFANVRNEMRIAREEIFGPVVSVIPFDDDEDAVRIANDSTFGLGGGILTKNVARGLAMAKRIRTGSLGINGAANTLGAPFGGFKESGIGREGGRFGLEEYTEVQTLTWPS